MRPRCQLARWTARWIVRRLWGDGVVLEEARARQALRLPRLAPQGGRLMAVRCPECNELAYRHPCTRRGRFCPLSPAQAFRRASEWRDDVRRAGGFTPGEARDVAACP